ncbi:hypothetical protein ACJX0J_017774, partial [Zea mays]
VTRFNMFSINIYFNAKRMCSSFDCPSIFQGSKWGLKEKPTQEATINLMSDQPKIIYAEQTRVAHLHTLFYSLWSYAIRKSLQLQKCRFKYQNIIKL